MQGVGSRLCRVWSRYGSTQTVFSGPVRKWKKRWVDVSSSSSPVTQSNCHKNSSSSSDASPLLLCKWNPFSWNPSESTGATPEEPPKRRFRYTPVAILEEQKKAAQEKNEDEETNMLTTQQNSETNEVDDLNVMGEWNRGMCLKGQSGELKPVGQTKDNQLIKSAIDDLF